MFSLKQCWDSWMSAMNNTEIPDAATVKYKHTTNRSNIKYQGWYADGLKEFSEIAKLIKSQRSQQYRQQIEENYKKHVEHKINSKYGIITPTPSKSTDSYIAYNDLSSDEDQQASTEQNQSSNANPIIGESDGNQCDMLNDNVENQMNAPTQKMVNDDGELIYIYLCDEYNLIKLKIYWIKLHVFASFVDYKDNESCSNAYSNRKNQFESFGKIVGHNSTAVWNGK